MCYVYCSCPGRTTECVMSAVHVMGGKPSGLCLLCMLTANMCTVQWV